MNEKRVATQKCGDKKLTVAVFGGGGGWGKRVVESFHSINYKVVIVEIETPPDEVKKAANENEVIFLAVPDPEINGILIETRDFLVKGKTVLDCASNKSGFATTLKEIASSGASVCSTHPMVMPTISPRGQNVIIMPVGNSSQLANDVAEKVFKAMGMNAEYLDFDQHADIMVILQMVPHLVQRILIDALGQGIADKNLTISDLSRLAPANYMLAELGVGRVGTQRTDVSAGIIASALQTRFGRKILGGIQSNLGQIIGAGDDRNVLSSLFTQGVNRIDPDGIWRKQMTDRTEAALTRLGNLRSRSCQIEAPNRPVILRDILNILNSYAVDMTALDSQVVLREDGTTIARFDIGISNTIDFTELAKDLKVIGCLLLV